MAVSVGVAVRLTVGVAVMLGIGLAVRVGVARLIDNYVFGEELDIKP